MKLIMENWNSYRKQLILEDKILNELKQLERIDEVSIQQIAKKLRVPVAKVLLMAKLLAPGAAMAGDTFADMAAASMKATTAAREAQTDHVKSDRVGAALAKEVASKLPNGQGRVIDIIYSSSAAANRNHNLSDATFKKSFAQDIAKELKAKGYKISGLKAVSSSAVSSEAGEITPSTLRVELMHHTEGKGEGFLAYDLKMGDLDISLAKLPLQKASAKAPVAKKKSFQDKFYDRVEAGTQGSLTGMVGGSKQ